MHEGRQDQSVVHGDVDEFESILEAGPVFRRSDPAQDRLQVQECILADGLQLETNYLASLKNSSTADSSRVRRNGGRLCQMRLP